MKSTPKTLLATLALGAFCLAGLGSAQAAPVCAPTYNLDTINNEVKLTANCTPDANTSIDALSGYQWTKSSGPAPANSTYSLIVETPAAADGKTYSVVATDSAGHTSVNPVGVTVVVGSPTPCNLKVLQAGGLSLGPVTISPGTSATLVPTCHGADNLDWYSDVGGSGFTHIIDPPGGIVFPATGTTKFKVVGSNDYGDSASNEVTVNAAVPVAAPSCSISPSSASKTTGGNTSQTFIASCTGSPDAWAWTIDGGAAGQSTSSFTTVNNLGQGSHPVTLIATNSGGPSNTATATLTVSAVSAPSCTISPTSSAKTTGSSNQLFSATCSGSPTSFEWSVDGNSVGTSINTYTTDANLGVGQHTVELVASNAGGPGNTASSTVTVSDPAPPPVNGCNIIPVTWASTVQIGITPIETMNNGQQYAFKVNLPANYTSKGGVLYIDPTTVARYVAISTKPCDFAAQSGTKCAGSARNNSPQLDYSTVASTNYCKVPANTDVYISVRNSNTATGADQCTGKCTYYMRW